MPSSKRGPWSGLPPACGTARPAAAAAPRAASAPSWGHALKLAEEERAWRELLPHLPENARLLWNALGDMRRFWRLLHHCEGQTLRVPRTEPADNRHPLCRTLGRPALRRLMAVFGGTSVYVPRCSALLTRLRQHEIIADFSRRTARGVSSVTAVSRLARLHGLSDRRIWQILKKDASVPAQARVLRRLRQSAEAAAQAGPPQAPPPDSP